MPLYACDVKSLSSSQLLDLVGMLPRAFACRLVEIVSLRPSGHQPPSLKDLKRVLSKPQKPEAPQINGKEMNGSMRLAAREVLAGRPYTTKTGVACWTLDEVLAGKPNPKSAPAWLDAAVDAERQYMERLERHMAELAAWEAWRNRPENADLEAIAIRAAEFASTVMPLDDRRLGWHAATHPAHPESDGCRLMCASDAEVKAHAKRCAELALTMERTVNIPRTEAERLRRTCEHFHRRRLRRATYTARQYWAAALGMSSKRHSPYCNPYSKRCWKQRKEQALEYGKFVLLTPPEGSDAEPFPLSEAMEASGKAQAARIYSITLGMEEIGERLGLTAVFFTNTMAPEFHPNPTKGFEKRSWTPKHSPMMAATTLQWEWSKFRALLEKAEIKPLGLQCKEPHADGCPHQHVMLWVRPEHVETVRKIQEKVYNGRTADFRVVEKGEYIDRKTGEKKKAASPASYILKYMLAATNATPEAVGVESKSIKKGNLDAIKAWRSENGVRGYSLMGVHGVQRVWQKIAAAGKKALADMPERAKNVRSLIDQRRHGEALLTLGAIKIVDDVEGRLKGIYEDKTNRYGETVKRWVGFIDTLTNETKMYLEKWGIKKVDGNSRGNKVTVIERVSRGAGEDGSITQTGSPEHALAGMEGIGKEGANGARTSPKQRKGFLLHAALEANLRFWWNRKPEMKPAEPVARRDTLPPPVSAPENPLRARMTAFAA